jgi:hypothetical protein
MNAARGFIPTMFIYPRQRMSPTLGKDGPPGALYKCSKNGWTNEDLFMSWLQHFFDHVKPNPQKPILPLLDNHYSHITLEQYKFCKQNGIIIVSIPPHSSHRVQPPDFTFFGQLKKAYHRECDIFLKIRAQRVIRPDDFAALFNKAYSSVATIAKSLSGFKDTGIYPLNPNLFTDEDFEHDLEVKDTSSKPQNCCQPVSQQGSPPIQCTLHLAPEPCISTEPDSAALPSTSSRVSTSFQNISSLPTPSCSLISAKGTTKQHSEIWT